MSWQTAKSILWTISFAYILTIPVRYFLLTPFYVPDSSMSPKFESGDLVLVNRLAYFSRKFRREEVIVFRDQADRTDRYMRRIIGLPMERVVINDGILSIRNNDDYKIKELPAFGTVIAGLEDIGALDAHEYFVVSNTTLESPSGMIDERFIIGVPIITVWPPKNIKVYTD
ncbi:MAG: signal peptidase I [bacterium]|nr:signal peptidase I [bacterium]